MTFNKQYSTILLILVSFLAFSCDKSEDEEQIPVPTALFSFEIDENNPFQVVFTNESERYESASWDFGDESEASIEDSPMHTYAQEGQYDVILTASNGVSTTKTLKTITIETIPLPVANFGVEVDDEDPLKVHFTNTSQYGETHFWDFGDGQGSSNVASPYYTYEGSGEYNVVLSVTGNGKTVTSEQLVTVTGIEPEPEPIPSVLYVNFEDKNPNINKFGNLDFSVIDNPDKSGMNTSEKVGKAFKKDANVSGFATAIGGGNPATSLDIDGNFDLVTRPRVSVLIWTESLEGTFDVKLEKAGGASIQNRFTITEEQLGKWVELVWEVNESDRTKEFDKIVLVPGNGGPGNQVYFVDDYRLLP